MVTEWGIILIEIVNLKLRKFELFNDIVDVIFGSPYGFLKWQLLGEKQWTFFPNKAEKDINRRIALLYDFSKTVINKRMIKEFNYLSIAKYKRRVLSRNTCNYLHIGQHMTMMEIKMMLWHILRHYEIQEVPDKMKNLQWKGKFLYSFDPIDYIKLVQKH